jgi:hypothetical protein
MPWIFGPEFPGHPKTVEMKNLKSFDTVTRAKAFKARVESFFLKQVDVFQYQKPWAPFPLAVMTCVGIEMMGSYKYGDAPGDRNGHFKLFLKDMDAHFADMQLTPDNRQEELAAFIYKGFRNSLAHGFYGKWVFITHDKKKAAKLKYNREKRFVVLNVYWFYERFKAEAYKYLDSLVAANDEAQEPLKTFDRTFKKNFSMWV